MALGALAAALLWLSFAQAWWNPIQDPDVFWQMWAGDQMRSGVFPRTNSFSWTAPDTPWTPHAPLVGLAYSLAGLQRIAVVRWIVVSATALLIACLAYRKDAGLATVFAIVWSVCLVTFGRTERALSWGNLMLALVAVLLFRVKEERGWRLPLAAIVVAVWANTHGSFVIGIMMIGLCRWRWGLVAAFLCLINPSGVGLFGLLLGYGLGQEAELFVHSAVPEWRALDLTGWLGWLRLTCLASSGYLLIRDKQWRSVILWSAIGILALRHQRFFDIFGIAILPQVADALARRLPSKAILHPLPILGCVLLMPALSVPRGVIDENTFPVDLLDKVPRNGRLWNDFALGGWLGYHGRACFWDSRNDCYPLAILEDGRRVELHEPGWQEVLDQRGVESMLTTDARKIKDLNDAGWRELGRDGNHTLLARTPES